MGYLRQKFIRWTRWEYHRRLSLKEKGKEDNILRLVVPDNNGLHYDEISTVADAILMEISSIAGQIYGFLNELIKLILL